MKKISAKELCQKYVGQLVYLDDVGRYGKIESVFSGSEQVVVITDYPVASVGVLVLKLDDFVRLIEKDDFVLVGVAQ